MTTHSDDLVSLEELRSLLKRYEGPDNPRPLPARGALRRWRPVLVAAVAAAALVGAGLAIADGLGAFAGISAAQNAQVGADLLPPGVLWDIKKFNAEEDVARAHGESARPDLLASTARVLGTWPDGSKVYGLTNTDGDLCIIGAPNEPGGGGCNPPLSKSQPTTFDLVWPWHPASGNPTLAAGGVAIDGVTSISFTVEPAGKEVTVPVTNNVWVYTEATSQPPDAHCVVAHFADGSTVDPSFPDFPCP
jgi:hypothetical protein